MTKTIQSIGDLNKKDFGTLTLMILKRVLTPKEYYLLYERLFHNESISSISKYLYLDETYLEEIENNILKKIAPYLNPNSDEYLSIMESLLNEDYEPQTEPLDIERDIEYAFLKEFYTSLERELFIAYYLSDTKISKEKFCHQFNITSEEYDNTLKSIITKRELCLKEKEKYLSFRRKYLKKSGLDDFYSPMLEHYSASELNEIALEFNDTTYEEIMESFGDNILKLDKEDQILLKRYFILPEYFEIHPYTIDREINIDLFSTRRKSKKQFKAKLLRTYLENIEEFNAEQRLYLECYYFNVKPVSMYDDKYPEMLQADRHDYLIERLERIYFNINRYSENNITKEKYLQVREANLAKLSEERLKILDLYYGVDGSPKTVSELAEMFNCEYTKMNDKISDARDYVISLYCNQTNTISINRNVYLPFINDKKYILTPETREILRLFVIECRSYDEISSITGLSKTRISNIITDGIRRLDFYRFDILTPYNIEEKTLNEFFKLYPNYTDKDKKIIYRHYVECEENKDTAENLGLSLEVTNRTIADFNRHFLEFQARNIDISEEDTKSVINLPIYETILTSEETAFLNHFYGFNGPKKTLEEICQEYGIVKRTVDKRLETIKNRIKLFKVGILKNDLLYIPREELSTYLKDDHLPISEKEYLIICHLFALEGKPYKTIEEIGNIYGEKKSIIKRRYQRAILSIKKYLSNEIEGNIHYKTDVEPNLRYFTKPERDILIYLYRDKKTYENIASILNISFNRVVGACSRIKSKLYDILHDPQAKKFDFAFYEEVVDNKDLPFYGDLETVKKIFDLYFGISSLERMGIPQIIKELNLPLKSSSVNRSVAYLMIAVCKYQEGITKDDEFTEADVSEYYYKYHDGMSLQHRSNYTRYFTFQRREHNVNSSNSRINDTIRFDLIRYKNPEAFDVRTATPEEIIRLLTNPNNHISYRVRESLLRIFNLRERDLLTEEEKKHVYRLLIYLKNIEEKGLELKLSNSKE